MSPPEPPSRTVFVTSTLQKGGFGGLTGADQICNDLATAASLPGAGSYLAWLSDSEESPSTRFVQETIPYQRLDGAVIASGWDELTGGTIRVPINLDQNGDGIPEGEEIQVWTHTGADGVAAPHNDCNNWTDSQSTCNWVGRTTEVGGSWTAVTNAVSCDFERRLYCFQQA